MFIENVNVVCKWMEIVTEEPVTLVPYIKIQFAMNSKKPLNKSGFLFSYKEQKVTYR